MMKNEKSTENSKSSNPNTQVIDEPERLIEGVKLLKKNNPGLTLDQIGDLFFNKFLYRRKFKMPK